MKIESPLTSFRPIIVGALYHPPKPIYDTTQFLCYFENCILEITHNSADSLIAIAGDANSLPDGLLLSNTGLLSIVTAPTRGSNCLDKIYVSEPLYENIKICKSAVKSDHNAIIAHNSGILQTRAKSSSQVKYRRKTPAQHAHFLDHISDDIFNDTLLLNDCQNVSDNFYDISNSLLDTYYPMRTVSITTADPDYMTPEIKTLLRKKNSLMRANQKEKASAIAEKIGKEIARFNSSRLKHLGEKSTTSELWDAVRHVSGKSKASAPKTPQNISASVLNDHYARISTDQSYTLPLQKSTASAVPSKLTEFQVFNILDTLHHTAEGLDKIPAWFLRIGAPIFSKVITHLFNLSISQSLVPLQWKTAIIHPIPKIPNPTLPSDFRPISVVPILSRMLEKIIVQNFFYPILQNPCSTNLFEDQFAFRATGSTTCAIISILHHITHLLSEDQSHVIMISLDFSKAFDSVRHSTLLRKMSSLPIPDHIYNWTTSYLDSRSHCTRFNDIVSLPNHITASVVQGSAIGPFSFLITASDLSPLSKQNKMFKFADDMYLVVPAENSHSIDSELDHIAVWANENNLKLNHSKSTEIIFSKKRTKVPLPPPTAGISRVSSITILGVHIENNLCMDEHVNFIISSCAQSLFALRMLKANGLPPAKIFEVFQATVLSKLCYASPAWYGYTNANSRDRIDAFINKSKRLEYCSPNVPCFADLCTKADVTLFNNVTCNTFHVLHPLLPDIKAQPYNLRPRAHQFVLPEKDTRNFINRMLFKDIY